MVCVCLSVRTIRFELNAMCRNNTNSINRTKWPWPMACWFYSSWSYPCQLRTSRPWVKVHGHRRKTTAISNCSDGRPWLKCGPYLKLYGVQWPTGLRDLNNLPAVFSLQSPLSIQAITSSPLFNLATFPITIHINWFRLACLQLQFSCYMQLGPLGHSYLD